MGKAKKLMTDSLLPIDKGEYALDKRAINGEGWQPIPSEEFERVSFFIKTYLTRTEDVRKTGEKQLDIVKACLTDHVTDTATVLKEQQTVEMVIQHMIDDDKIVILEDDESSRDHRQLILHPNFVVEETLDD